jgi:hypothetical protein
LSEFYGFRFRFLFQPFEFKEFPDKINAWTVVPDLLYWRSSDSGHGIFWEKKKESEVIIAIILAKAAENYYC